MHRNVWAVSVAVAAIAGCLMAADVRLGTWKLNVAKSKMTGGPAVKSQIDIREALPDGRVQTTRTRELADGKTEKYIFSYKYDGRDYPVRGAPFDMIAVKRIDNQTTRFEATKKGTKYEVIGTTVVSTDLRTLTQTSKGTDANGNPVASTLIFDRK